MHTHNIVYTLYSNSFLILFVSNVLKHEIMIVVCADCQELAERERMVREREAAAVQRAALEMKQLHCSQAVARDVTRLSVQIQSLDSSIHTVQHGQSGGVRSCNMLLGTHTHTLTHTHTHTHTHIQRKNVCKTLAETEERLQG